MMEKRDEGGFTLPYETYADYVESTYSVYDRHDWLVEYLRQGTRNFDSWLYHTQIKVLDSIDGSLESRSFKVGAKDAIDESFLDVLRSPPSGRQTRLILLNSFDLDNTNRVYIDAIGHHYTLDPNFFSAHFQRRDLKSNSEGYASGILPSERRFLQVVTYGPQGLTHMTTTWNVSSDERTFILLELGHGELLDRLYHELVSCNDPATVRNMDKNPPDFLFPYIRNSARLSASFSAKYHSINRDVGERSMDYYDWKRNTYNCQALTSSMNSLHGFLAYPEIDPGDRPLRLRGLLQDYKTLIEESQAILLDLQGNLQQDANLAAIEETKKGIAQGDSMRRLQLIAFIFIPLNFATSFFGMNFTQLGSGPLHIGYFFLLCVLVGIVSTALSLSMKPLEAAMLQARKLYFREHEHMNNVDDKSLAEVTKRGMVRHFIKYDYLLALASKPFNHHDNSGFLDTRRALGFRHLMHLVSRSFKDFARKFKTPRPAASDLTTYSEGSHEYESRPV